MSRDEIYQEVLAHLAMLIVSSVNRDESIRLGLCYESLEQAIGVTA